MKRALLGLLLCWCLGSAVFADVPAVAFYVLKTQDLKTALPKNGKIDEIEQSKLEETAIAHGYFEKKHFFVRRDCQCPGDSDSLRRMGNKGVCNRVQKRKSAEIKEGEVKSTVKNLDEVMDFSAGGILSKVLVKTSKCNHTLFCMAKGTDISEHTTTREAAVTVLKGTGVFFLGRKKIKMEPGTFIFMPPNAPHALRADEDLALLLSLAG